MGTSRWDADDWSSFTASTATLATDHIYASRTLENLLDPMGVAIRESRDSDANPESTPIIVALDVTGSMGMLADALAREGLGTLIEEIYDRKPVTDPHIMVMGIGDEYCDRAPLQVTQFEASTVLVEQLTKLWLEKGGGGNDHESYDLPWYFAAKHTSIDCYEKRGKKGYLFTVGDEEPSPTLRASAIRKFLGDEASQDIPAKDLLAMVSRYYEVFHIIVEEGSHARAYMNDVVSKWTDLLGQNVIRLSDHKKLAEVIVSTLEVLEGRDKAAVAGSWSGTTAMVVARAIETLPAKMTDVAAGGLMRL